MRDDAVDVRSGDRRTECLVDGANGIGHNVRLVRIDNVGSGREAVPQRALANEGGCGGGRVFGNKDFSSPLFSFPPCVP